MSGRSLPEGIFTSPCAIAKGPGNKSFSREIALNALGVSILPINPDLRADDLAYQLSVAEPHLAVALP